MDPDLQKFVEAGKITTADAGQLEQLKPGTFCLHKSWGFGRVADWNLLLNQILIDFEKKKAHPMQLHYAAENLTPIPAGHFLAPKSQRSCRAQKSAERRSRRGHAEHSRGSGRKATQAQISGWLLGDIFSEPEFKRWWDSTKKLLKKERHFLIPTKKTDPVELRAVPVSRADELITFFNQARQPQEQAAALDQIIKLHSEFEDPEKQLQPLNQRD